MLVHHKPCGALYEKDANAATHSITHCMCGRCRRDTNRVVGGSDSLIVCLLYRALLEKEAILNRQTHRWQNRAGVRICKPTGLLRQSHPSSIGEWEPCVRTVARKTRKYEKRKMLSISSLAVCQRSRGPYEWLPALVALALNVRLPRAGQLRVPVVPCLALSCPPFFLFVLAILAHGLSFPPPAISLLPCLFILPYLLRLQRRFLPAPVVFPRIEDIHGLATACVVYQVQHWPSDGARIAHEVTTQ